MVHRRKKRKYPQAVSTLIGKLFSDFGAQEQLQEFQIRKEWRSIVGDRLADRSAPKSLKKGRLVVTVTDSGWMAQMRMMSSQIIKSIHRTINSRAIKEIFFSLGQIEEEKIENEPLVIPNRRLTPAEEQRIQECISHTPDPEVKEVVRRIMRKQMMLKR